jgi:site-specific DNA recombinase
MTDSNRKKRCVVYCRKSVEDSDVQNFNSIDAQREAGENYIASQKANGWMCVSTRYDDYGFSGGNTDRPALKQLLADCKVGLVDIVVVYKIDRLSRSLEDFAEMVKLFDEYGIQFVSVTQEINTATSSGRMMLNILMTFAQYEREIISERTRDKLFMSRQKGMYTGGMTVLGYKAVNKKLEIVPEEAEIVKFIFRRYIEIQSPKHIARELNAQNITTKNGFKWNRNRVNVILNNYVYNGKIFYHHQTVFDGEHEAIIDDDTWNRTREIMKANANSNDLTKRTRQDIPMRGKAFCGHCDKAFIPLP